MNCWTAGRMNHVKRLWCLQFGFQSAVLWSSLAFKQRSNRTKQNHELTNQHNQRTVPLFNRGLTLSSQNSQWLDFWQLLDWWFSSVSTGARRSWGRSPRPDSQRQKAPKYPIRSLQIMCWLLLSYFLQTWSRRRLRRKQRSWWQSTNNW